MESKTNIWRLKQLMHQQKYGVRKHKKILVEKDLTKWDKAL